MILSNLFTPKTALAQGPADPAEIAAFFDGVMLSNMEDKHVPGAAIVVVKDGKILFSKGYGYANVEKGITVDPGTTLFRIGSISKLFTWTAVMQLAEQGKLDLEADVNAWLDFEIPATYPEPITMKHLLSHTSGFEDRAFGAWAAEPEALIPLGTWLKTHIPARVRPAGTIAAYSNYGTSLAGYIVERVSGMDYETYIEQHIAQPLGMGHTSARQPLPAALAADVAKGYRFANGSYTPLAFETLNIAPAGAISARPADMAHFMIAHLQDGQYGNARILQTETAQQMHARLFSHDPRIDGLAYGFFEMERGGQRILWHGGDTLLFHSQLALLPEQNVGFFASCNSAECGGFPQAIFEAFMTHYYPTTEVAEMPISDQDTRTEQVAGRYRSTRMSHTTAQKLTSLLSSTKFSALDDGTLLVGGEARFVEVAPLIFHQVGGENTLAFLQDEDGAITHAALGGSPSALERVPLLDTPLINYTLLGIGMALFLSMLMGGPLLALARSGCDMSAQPLLAQVARGILAGMALTCLIFLALVGLGAATGQQAVIVGRVPFGKVWPVLFGCIVLLALVALASTLMVWQKEYWSLFGRVHYTLVTLATWALIWFVNHWHLLHW